MTIPTSAREGFRLRDVTQIGWRQPRIFGRLVCIASDREGEGCDDGRCMNT